MGVHAGGRMSDDNKTSCRKWYQANRDRILREKREQAFEDSLEKAIA
jgi:hypothetical protein